MHFSLNITQPWHFIPSSDFSTGSQEVQIVPIVTGTKKLCLLLRRKTLFGNEEEKSLYEALQNLLTRVPKHSESNPRGVSVFTLKFAIY